MPCLLQTFLSCIHTAESQAKIKKLDKKKPNLGESWAYKINHLWRIQSQHFNKQCRIRSFNYDNNRRTCKVY